LQLARWSDASNFNWSGKSSANGTSIFQAPILIKLLSTDYSIPSRCLLSCPNRTNPSAQKVHNKPSSCRPFDPRRLPHKTTMITRYLTEVVTRFNPFLPSARAARIFLTNIPAEARLQMRVSSTILPKSSPEKPLLEIKFSTLSLSRPARVRLGVGMQTCFR